MIETEDNSSGNQFFHPPPPPPLPNFSYSNKSIQTGNSSTNFQENDLESFEKAVRRVTEADNFLHTEPFHSFYTHLKSQLQEGPKCGLVALSIATSIIDSFISADELFDEALGQGYTTQGEMYSCENLAELAERTTHFHTLVIEGGIHFHLECIFHCIQNGGLMLIPYDADFNHSPCCRNGKSAHWAVISGIVIFRMKDESERDKEKVLKINRQDFPGCQCVKKNFFKDFPDGGKVRIFGNYVALDQESCTGSAIGKIYLAGKQGKSLHLSLWSFDKLAESNLNLNDLSDEQKVKNFVLPQGGVAAGLKGKAVLLMPKIKQ